MSWKMDLTKRSAELTRLAELDVPVTTFGSPVNDGTDLAAMMRQHGAETRRQHAVDAFITHAPTLTAEELVDELDRRGLLAPPDDPV
jgi:hypothetical protein